MVSLMSTFLDMPLLSLTYIRNITPLFPKGVGRAQKRNVNLLSEATSKCNKGVSIKSKEL